MGGKKQTNSHCPNEALCPVDCKHAWWSLTVVFEHVLFFCHSFFCRPVSSVLELLERRLLVSIHTFSIAVKPAGYEPCFPNRKSCGLAICFHAVAVMMIERVSETGVERDFVFFRADRAVREQFKRQYGRAKGRYAAGYEACQLEKLFASCKSQFL